MSRHFPDHQGEDDAGYGILNIFLNSSLLAAFLSFLVAQLSKPFTHWYGALLYAFVVLC
jgi:hypothetical protein